MGRDITWPSGDVYENYLYSRMFIAENYQSFRGSGANDNQVQYGRRIWLNADGSIKKGTNKYEMLEEQTCAPLDFKKTEEVPVKVGDYMVTAVRTVIDRDASTSVSIYRLKEIKDTHLNFEDVSGFSLERSWYNEKVPEDAYRDLIDEKFLKAVKKVLKVPKRLREKGEEEPG